MAMCYNELDLHFENNLKRSVNSVSNDPKQGGGQKPTSDLPPYERIMQQNTAQAKNPTQQAPQKAKTLEDAAAQRAEARRKAMQAAAARQRAAQSGMPKNRLVVVRQLLKGKRQNGSRRRKVAAINSLRDEKNAAAAFRGWLLFFSCVWPLSSLLLCSLAATGCCRRMLTIHSW